MVQSILLFFINASKIKLLYLVTAVTALSIAIQ